MDKPNKELQEAFGKVVYALAKIDGEVQQIEIDTLYKVIEENQWAKEVLSSFNKETKLDNDPNKIFPKAMKVFRENGDRATPHYPFFLDLLEKMAMAHDGIVPEEQKLLDLFKQALEEPPMQVHK